MMVNESRTAAIEVELESEVWNRPWNMACDF